MSEWKPIETAPKSKTLLLGFKNEAGKWRTTRGCYFSKDWIEDNWDCDSEDGWYETPVEGEECYPIVPTHYMLLPAAPKD